MHRRPHALIVVACLLAVLCAGLVAPGLDVAVVVHSFGVVPERRPVFVATVPAAAPLLDGVLAVHPHRGPPSA